MKHSQSFIVRRYGAIFISLTIFMHFFLTTGSSLIFANDDNLDSESGNTSSAGVVEDVFKNYDISIKEDYGTTKPGSLRDGEIWTGKHVVHDEENATVTVTLSAWGRIWQDWDGKNYNSSKSGPYLNPLAGDGCVTIVDNLFEFKLSGGFAGLGNAVLNETEGKITWSVNQSDILGGMPATITYTLELDSDKCKVGSDWKTNYWYSTGIAETRFTPATGNPFYWTMDEVTFDSFTMSMNWNNGNGLNSGTITDAIFEASIVFGSNASPEYQYAYEPNSHKSTSKATEKNWIANARYSNKLHFWHLEWEKLNTVKDYWFIVRDLEAPGIDVVYQVHFPNPGGNSSMPAGRTRLSTNYFKRTFEGNTFREKDPGSSDKLFKWDGDDIVISMPVIGQALLMLEVFHEGSLKISKKLEGWYDIDWNVTETTDFKTIIKDENGYYLTFVQTGPYSYRYTGVTGFRYAASELTFSTRNPAVITNVPENKICTAEELLDFDTYGLIEVSYSNKGVFIAPGQERETTITNKYGHGVGYLEIHKLMDGFPSDWGVDDNTVFYVRVWDADWKNNLLFKNTPEQDGTYWCVGNDEIGLSEAYVGQIMKYIPIKAGETVKLSNLWTWGSYEVIEVIHAKDPLNNIFSENYIGSDEWIDAPKITQNADGSIDENNKWITDENWKWGVSYSDNNGTRDLHFNETISVSVTNRYKHGTGNLIIFKELGGYPSDWGVTADTVFRARIWDDAEGAYLLFKDTPETDGSYIHVGDSSNGITEGYNGKTISEIPFSVTNPIVLKNLYTGAGHRYRVEEILPSEYSGTCTVSYTLNNNSLESAAGGGIVLQAGEDASMLVTVKNTFKRSARHLTIFKELQHTGFPGEWEVDKATVFYAKVKDVSAGNYLKFKNTPEANGTYMRVDDSYTGKTISEVPFSAEKPVVLSNLIPGREYAVEENFVITDIMNDYTNQCVISYKYENNRFASDESMTATVTNAFTHRSADITIDKAFAKNGNHENWGINDSTRFYARVKDTTTGKYVLFMNKTVPDILDQPCYWAVGLTDGTNEEFYTDYDGNTISRLPFSVDNPARVLNLLPGHTYEIEEVFNSTAAYKDFCESSYSLNTVFHYVDGHDHIEGSHIVVTNSFECCDGSCNKDAKPSEDDCDCEDCDKTGEGECCEPSKDYNDNTPIRPNPINPRIEPNVPVIPNQPTSFKEQLFVSFEAQKRLTGFQIEANMFSFAVKDDKGNIVSVGTNDENGNISFGRIYYKELGTYDYTIYEVGSPMFKGYDMKQFPVTVNVYIADGQYKADIDYKADNIIFSNTWDDSCTFIKLSGFKILNGTSNENNLFSFVIEDDKGNIVSVGTNKEDGNINFGYIFFSSQTEHGFNRYTLNYKIYEIGGEAIGITYDREVCNIIADIIENDGAITASYRITNIENKIIFNNDFQTVISVMDNVIPETPDSPKSSKPGPNTQGTTPSPSNPNTSGGTNIDEDPDLPREPGTPGSPGSSRNSDTLEYEPDVPQNPRYSGNPEAPEIPGTPQTSENLITPVSNYPDANPKTGVTFGITALIIASSVTVISKKRKLK